jgi:hypothetical protein
MPRRLTFACGYFSRLLAYLGDPSSLDECGTVEIAGEPTLWARRGLVGSPGYLLPSESGHNFARTIASGTSLHSAFPALPARFLKPHEIESAGLYGNAPGGVWEQGRSFSGCPGTPEGKRNSRRTQCTLTSSQSSASVAERRTSTTRPGQNGRHTLGSDKGVVEERRRGIGRAIRVAPRCPLRLAISRLGTDSGEGLARDGAGSVRTREYEKDGATHRVLGLRADSIRKLDRAEASRLR